MRHGVTIASAFVALGFAVISFILIVVEPDMGFRTFADYLEPDLVIPASGSAAWLVGDLFYLGFAVALSILALDSADRLARVTAFASALFFLFVASFDRMLATLPGTVTDPVHLHAAVLGLLTARFAALKVTIFCLSVFAWRSAAAPGSGSLFRGLGILVLLAGTAFVFVFLPVPVLFAAWFLVFAVRSAREPSAIEGGRASERSGLVP